MSDRASSVIVAIEVQSQIGRLEEQIRWAGQKADARLASGPFAGTAPDVPRVFRVLALASTEKNREVLRRFTATVHAAYPAPPEQIVRALTAGDPWPGSGLVWLSIHGHVARLLPGSPRGLGST